MKRYRVSFYYQSDVRHQRVAEASHAADALIDACEDCHTDNGYQADTLWTWLDNGPGFGIEIVEDIEV